VGGVQLALLVVYMKDGLVDSREIANVIGKAGDLGYCVWIPKAWWCIYEGELHEQYNNEIDTRYP
jgi:hypothetical protein